MYPASVIAYAFVKKGIDEGNPVTQMKLQKMVYFAHGVHLAKYNEPLIKEDVQAWQYGPVVPAIYQSYKAYGSSLITDASLVFIFSSKQEILDKYAELKKDHKSSKTIDITWELLKNKDAVRLSAWTHIEGSPWQTHFRKGEPDILIPNEDIRSYFMDKFKIGHAGK